VLPQSVYSLLPPPEDPRAIIEELAKLKQLVAQTPRDIAELKQLAVSAQRKRSDRRPWQSKRFLSKREAAQFLGVDRGTTLQALIDGGDLRTVVIVGRVKIPVSEVERLEAGADRPTGSKSAGRKIGTRRQINPGQAIRALKLK
jgi:hypothetical protein